jgi:hypothetical protein
MTCIQFACPISSFRGMVVSDKASQWRGRWFNTLCGERLYCFFHQLEFRSREGELDRIYLWGNTDLLYLCVSLFNNFTEYFA